MIRLLLFAPCEKILTSDDNVSSLISVLESINVTGEIAEQLVPNAGLPIRWSASCLWHRETEVAEPIQYDAKVDFFSPNGELAMGSALQFTVSNEFLNYRNAFNFPLFPIGQKGVCLLRLSYKQTGTETWEQVGEYPIQVIHDIKEVKNEVENGVEAKQSVESV